MPTSGTYRHFSPKRWERAHLGRQPLAYHHQWFGLSHMAQRKQLPHSAQLYTISRTRISARVLRPAGRHGSTFEVMFLAPCKPHTIHIRTLKGTEANYMCKYVWWDRGPKTSVSSKLGSGSVPAFGAAPRMSVMHPKAPNAKKSGDMRVHLVQASIGTHMRTPLAVGITAVDSRVSEADVHVVPRREPC